MKFKELERIRCEKNLTRREFAILLGFSPKGKNANARWWEFSKGMVGISPAVARQAKKISRWTDDKIEDALSEIELWPPKQKNSQRNPHKAQRCAKKIFFVYTNTFVPKIRQYHRQSRFLTTEQRQYAQRRSSDWVVRLTIAKLPASFDVMRAKRRIAQLVRAVAL